MARPTSKSGLYSQQSGERLPLQGETDGQRAYRVAQFDMHLESDNLFVVFKDGWHATEFGTEGPGREWQWSRKDGILSFRNPKRDVRFYLQLDQPVPNALSEPQQVDIRLGDLVLERFALPGGGSELRRIDISAGQLGAAETVDLTIATDKTFVPASVPALKSSDPRARRPRVPSVCRRAIAPSTSVFTILHASRLTGPHRPSKGTRASTLRSCAERRLTMGLMPDWDDGISL